MSYPRELDDLQDRIGKWAEKNFGKCETYQPLLCVVEEVGELSHAHLKQEQGIRGTDEEHITAGKDAVADIGIALMHYCHLRKWDFENLLYNTFNEVEQRDWKKNKETGKVN